MERGHHYITRGLCAFMAVITAICALPAEGLAAREGRAFGGRRSSADRAGARHEGGGESLS